MVDDREMILEESVTSLYNLRGTADADLSSTVAMNKYYVYEETSRFLQNSNSSSSGITTANSDNQSFAIMLAVLVTLILLFFVVCTYQVLRNWLCKLCCGRDLRRSNNTATPLTDADTVLVHDGRVFNLTGDQRRAVLEAIFSETSKVRFFWGEGGCVY